jgi:hypothetical protein
VLRAGGAALGSAWRDGASGLAAAVGAVAEARSRAPQPLGDVDAVELCLSHSYRDARSAPGLLSNVHRGVLGVEFEYGEDLLRYSPTQMLAENLSFEDVVTRFERAHADETLAGDVNVRVFACDQVYVDLSGERRALQMFRGDITVPLAAVTQRTVRTFAERMGEWLVRQVDADGRIVYKYWPSLAEESDATNTVRQWMASVALGRFAAAHGDDPEIYRVAADSISYNLDRFYKRDGDFGLIVEEQDEDVKLGAVALAALAIVEHPERARFAEEEEALRRTVDHLWQKDGSFRTFYVPERRNDNQNFYPGEALVLWSRLYEDERDPELRERFMKTFRYYRRWHLAEENRNPAFVPWHTMAYHRLWRLERDDELASFVFEMNDWLLDVQQWDEVPYDDLRGRFYDPDRPFGPPHASSTGVYIEGLIAAYDLAKRVEDEQRAERYRLAIRRGLRSAMQLQFDDGSDMYYVTKPDRVSGGLKTNPYDNEIRVDNVQHNLMGVLEILERFDKKDYTNEPVGS